MKTKTFLPIFLFLLFAVTATWAETINLATVATDKSLQDGDELKVADGDVLTGTLNGNYKISIADGATVTLDGVTINGVNDEKYKWAGITCEGNCNIILAENSLNRVKGFYEFYPGIYAREPIIGIETYTLTISGTGSLVASSNGDGAGIGGGLNIGCGNIVINGGIIAATGGHGAAGIGGGFNIGGGLNIGCGNIVINGGIIAATGGNGAAGIGGGYVHGGNVSIGNITIGGGTITATGGEYAAGIGGGFVDDGNVSIGDITISGGTIAATGGEYAAGIGGGYVVGGNGSIGNITIGSDKIMVSATKGDYAPYSIGKGEYGSRTGKITIGGVETSDIEKSPFVYSKKKRLTHTDIAVAAIDDHTYIGSEICPTVSVTDGETPLELGSDYTTTCTNNISAGTAEITITGKGDYTGSISKTFKIMQKEITIDWAKQTSFVYNGTEQAPTATVKGLVTGDECTVTVSGAAKNIGTSYTATVTALCNANYKLPEFNLKKTFEITPKEISIAWGAQTSFTYDGLEHIPTATVEGLLGGDNCELTVTGAQKNAGTYTATVTALSNANYKLPAFNLKKTFAITPKEISIAWGEQTSFTYDGTEHIPTATVEGLLDGDNCELTVTGAQKNAGMHTATATALYNSNYKLPGIAPQKTFEIMPKEISIAWGKQTSFFYTGVEQAPTATAEGLVSGDECKIAVSGAKNVGTYTAKATALSNTNYKLPKEILEKQFKIYVNKITKLDDLDGNYVAQDGEVLTGTLNGNYKISIAAGATVILNGVTINGVDNIDYNWPGITCEGNCNIILAENSRNIVTGFYSSYPGIEVPYNKTLTISGSGYLEASSNGYAAGIGGASHGNVGNIVINGGTIIATGGHSAAGIGCGVSYGAVGNHGSITINGGDVTAIGGNGAAGIGSGYHGEIYDITISGGIVKATGGENAAGIGTGQKGEVIDIMISGGVVKATGGNGAVGIGCGKNGSVIWDFDISGDTKVTAIKGKNSSYSIGKSDGGSIDVVTIGGIETQGITTSPFVWIPLTHSDITVADIADQTYTGSAICPAVSITDEMTPLEAGVDYVVECTDNISAGTAKMTITGMGNYAGAISKTFKIKPKEVTIAWGEQTTFSYDGAEHIPIATVEGLLDGDNCELTVTGAQKNAGTHTAKATALSNSNYKLPTETEKVFTITKAPLTVTAKNKTITYGDKPSNGGVECAGFIDGEDESLLGGTLAYGFDYKQYGDIGNYVITPSGLTADNYEIEFVAGKLTVEPKEIFIAWGEQTSFVYNGTEQAPTATAEGLLNGDECTITVAKAKDAGTHTASATALSNTNYKLPTENLEKTFEIKQKEISIAWGELTLFYNGTEQAPTAKVEGLINDDDCSITVSGAAKKVGTYKAMAAVVCNDNYKVPTKNLITPFEIFEGINLALLPGEFFVSNDAVLGGTFDGSKQPYKIIIADGATVTLKGVTINGVDDEKYKWAGITCDGDCHIILAENSVNKVKGFYENYPGIYVPDGHTLTISGTGSLEASSNGYGAGIGCGYSYYDFDLNCGNIAIRGGTINATGGDGAAGIGGSMNGSVGNIEISGGTITATGGSSAAGVGGGLDGSVGNISISGDETKVTATTGKYAPYSIGKGYDGSRTGKITIGGIETSDIDMDTFKYPYLMLVYEDGNGKHAVLNGEYSGDESVNITEDIKNVAVTFSREFTPNSGFATIMLPFNVNASSLTGVRSVIEFDGIKTDENDNKMVGMKYVWCDATLGEQEGKEHPERNCNNYSGELKAYTPYMVDMKSATLGIEGEITLKPNSGKTVGDASKDNWVFRGTLQKKEWPKGTGIINEGRLWAFAAAKRSGAKIGEFVQFGGNNWANPFRAYLVECKKTDHGLDCSDEDSETQPSLVSKYRFADALAPTDSVATDQPLVMRQAAASETASLNSMDIVIVYGDKDSDGDKERPTVIGRYNPATGEIRMLPRTKQTYDLKGRRVGNSKKAKGAYYNRR